MAQNKLILASSSPRRQELIRVLGLPVEIIPSDADESVNESWAPDKIVKHLALRKAYAVKRRMASEQGAFIVGSDTIVVLDGRVLGKPRDAAEAKAMLSALQGRQHHVFTGLAVVDAGASVCAGAPSSEENAGITRLGDASSYSVICESGEGKPGAIAGCTVSKVTFLPMNDMEIEAYVKTGDPLDKAGSYGVQGMGSVFIEKIEGDFYSIMGLPLNLLYKMLLRFGISPFK